jgi:hypothetical protein
MIEYTPEELIELLEWEIKSLQAELAQLKAQQ